jgi:hypothetical protein
MNILHLFSWSYWFLRPSPASGFAYVFFLLIAAACIILGMVFKLVIFSNAHDLGKRVLFRISNLMIIDGIVLFFWFIFRQEQIVFFSMRLWLLVLVGITVWRTIVSTKFIKKRIPELLQERERKNNFYNYLPQSKN